jgi:hypothetical protein
MCLCLYGTGLGHLLWYFGILLLFIISKLSVAHLSDAEPHLIDYFLLDLIVATDQEKPLS